MNLIFLLLSVALFGAISAQRKLSHDENQELQRVCGVKATQQEDGRIRSIYNGVEISGFEAPWTVSLYFGGDKCSGALISNRHVLTATHCLRFNSTSRIQVLDRARKICDKKDMIYIPRTRDFWIYKSNLRLLSSDVSRITLINMCFFDDYRHDDLAILELREDIPYSLWAQPICTAKNMDLQKLETWIQVTGFGLNYRDTIGNSTIQHPVLRHAKMQISHLPPNVHFFGTENRAEEIGLREGDSGGPGFIEGADHKNILMGVASTGGGLKAYFASVGKHAKEICHHTGIC